MKGVIFTEFVDFVEGQFGADTAARMIAVAHVPSGGAYSAVGHYGHDELVRLVGQLSAMRDLSTAEVLRRFGTHLFHHFAAMYPAFLDGIDSTLSFLASIDTTIHGELQKLYPDAEFPTFECATPERGRLEMVYRSRRSFADLAEGLILGCAEHFGEPLVLRRENLPGDDGQAVRFSLTRLSS